MTLVETTRDVFDVCGPLPTGTVVLEASAGTGKTFTIAALAARYVAAGTPLDRLLLVTFTRMATGELRERVRDRLVSAERGLARAVAGVPPDPADDVLALLATGDPVQVEARRRRLAAALSDFDAATIATTHGFCQHILAGLGVAGDVDEPDLVEDATDLVDEVVGDLYIRRFAPGRDDPPFGLEDARRIGRLAVEHPLAPVEPVAAPAGSVGAMRRRLALAVRDEVERRKRRLGIVTYDDLLTRLATILRDPVRGPGACARLRARYRVALVDEFQDTDPVQWEILRRAFGGSDEDRALVLIGDPKQAIYAFRGADVHAYLDAARTARTTATLGVNWRSDQGLLDAYDALMGGTRLGHDDIVHRPVRAAHREPRLVGAPDPAPLRFRIVDRDLDGIRRTPKGYVTADSALDHVARDLAGDVARLLSSGAELIGRGDEVTARSPLGPGDVAVLVRTHRHGARVREALVAAGVPAVLNGAGSVFTTSVARAWLTLLEALERPSSPVRAHAVALTPFIGWDAVRVATATDPDWEDVYARLHRWAGVLRRRGVAPLVEAIHAGESLPRRLLATAGGERTLTDLRHIGQLLHAEAVGAGLGISALAAWLRRRIADAPADGGDEDRTRRLESDAESVQVLTIHRAKGIEFPVVYFPYLWEPGWIPADGCPVYHDPVHGGQRTIDVATGGRALAEHRLDALAEQRGEDLRLAYVALTRARHQAVVWWASTWESRSSPLGRLLVARDPEGRVAAEGTAVPTEDDVRSWCDRLAATAPGCVSVATATGEVTRWSPDRPDADRLAARRFDRSLDLDWQRTSYSSITAAAHEARPGAGREPGPSGAAHEPEPGQAPVDDEVLPDEISAVAHADEPVGDGTPVPLADVPAGAAVGTVLHAVLETVDFTVPDLDAELSTRTRVEQERARVDLGDLDRTVAGLRAAIETPLGPLTGGRSLRTIGRRDRLDELAFELPLASGRSPGATVAMLGDLLRDTTPPGDPLDGYADRLGTPELQRELRGFLNGSIDAVLRLGTPDDPRFVVVDYKTNRLCPPGETLTVDHYRPVAVADAMQRAHYPLQALLYAVALHRYLRARLVSPRYDPDRHLGGILYLFLRGMTGPSVPLVDGVPCGVWVWRPPAGLVPALSDLLDEGPR